MQKGIQIGVNEIVEIAFGTLLNKPSISFFTQICDNPSAVRRGDLFILTQKDSTQAQRDIEEAVQRGAFGILFSGNIAMNDEEVAWISVEDLEQSLMRILRHYLMMHNKILFLLDSDEYAIATQIIVPKKNLGFYCGSLSGLISYILQSEMAYFLHCNMNLNMESLPKNQQEIKILPQDKINENALPFSINSYSLFNIRIFYKSADYEILLPRLFVQSLARILRFCETYSFAVQLENFTFIANFKPLFLDERGVIAKPGTTNKVLLACNNDKLYGRYLAYFTMNAKWAHLVLFVPSAYQEIYAPCAKTFSYDRKEELFSSLIRERYNFALILGVDTQTLEERFVSQTHEVSLFEYTIKE